MRSEVAEQLRREQRDDVLRLAPEERIALALRLGAEAVAMYAAAHGVDRATAERELKRQRRAGRIPSRCIEELDP